jgi:hypothetical protein
MPRSKEFLLEQIARAKRFARAMNTDADRERFEKMAADYRRELDAAEAEGQSSASPTASETRFRLTMPLRPSRSPAGSDAAAPASGSTDDQEPTTD